MGYRGLNPSFSLLTTNSLITKISWPIKKCYKLKSLVFFIYLVYYYYILWGKWKDTDGPINEGVFLLKVHVFDHSCFFFTCLHRQQRNFAQWALVAWLLVCHHALRKRKYENLWKRGWMTTKRNPWIPQSLVQFLIRSTPIPVSVSRTKYKKWTHAIDLVMSFTQL